MSAWLWQSAYVLQKLAVLAVVWIIVQRRQRTAPIACRCLKWSIGLALAAAPGGIFLTPILRRSFTGMSRPAVNIVEVLLTDSSAWLYLGVTGASASLVGIANLLVAYAALGHPDRRHCEPVE